MITPKLSICIASLHTRSALLSNLLARLSGQARVNEIEILVDIDGGAKLTGQKRNALVARAIGDYIVHVDDDDNVSDYYVSKILFALDLFAPTVDVVVLRGLRVDINGIEPPVYFDYRLMVGDRAETDKDGVMWRSPGHLCPIRRDIAKAVPFPDGEPEDLMWVERACPLIGTIARAGDSDEVLYYYQWDSKKVARWQ